MIWRILAFIPAKLWRLIALIIGGLGFVLWSRNDAVNDDRLKTKAKQAEADTKARGKANEALRKERAADGDSSVVVKRLRGRDAKWK